MILHYILFCKTQNFCSLFISLTLFLTLPTIFQLHWILVFKCFLCPSLKGFCTHNSPLIPFSTHHMQTHLVTWQEFQPSFLMEPPHICTLHLKEQCTFAHSMLQKSIELKVKWWVQGSPTPISPYVMTQTYLLGHLLPNFPQSIVWTSWHFCPCPQTKSNFCIILLVFETPTFSLMCTLIHNA